jgi:hypothetical protein
MNGADTATASVMAAYARDTASRDHENSSANGLSSTGNVKTYKDVKKTPAPPAKVTRQGCESIFE